MVNRGFILNMLEPKFIGHGLLLNLELYIEMRCNSSYNPAVTSRFYKNLIDNKVYVN